MIGKTKEELYIEFVVFVEKYEWAVISKSLGLNKTNTEDSIVGKHSSHFLQQIQLRLLILMLHTQANT